MFEFLFYSAYWNGNYERDVEENSFQTIERPVPFYNYISQMDSEEYSRTMTPDQSPAGSHKDDEERPMTDFMDGSRSSSPNDENDVYVMASGLYSLV